MAKQKPIIGISLDLQNDGEGCSYAKYPWYALRRNYADAVTQAGGIPIMLPYDEGAIEDILEIIDGLVVPGGDADIDPAFYGQEIKSDKVAINHKRTEYDLNLMKKALEKNMPVLGICYGMQLMNVLCGGSLIQDIPTFYDTDIIHTQPHPKGDPWHSIAIYENNKLHKIYTASGETILKVNSTHHQAIDRVGEGLIVTAKAPDGIIEAIESIKHRFVLGVEWHPEYQTTALDKALFKEFISACRV